MDRRKIRVLLVEDQEIHRVVARAVLRAAGVEADEAKNGAEAVRRVRDGGAGAYDLILTDKQMPVMDGHEVYIYMHPRCARQPRPPDEYVCVWRRRSRACMQATRQIRAMGVTTTIVAVSSDSLPSDVQAFIAAGADDFTPKPLTKEKLGNILSKFGLA
ncbi:two-component response regulator ORR41-like isoform X1 [Hordeum vulgare subsp. vulgare]|uniref:two-component response regulator ORR41-like isoform X1 n=1 Tax=Hordeum vulgare subsp. vulgare TaxID=112509 RepID=UPI000B4810A4|nr:two-component response regulator ORR41-like isoform X1 [Hordeum vulgare subsp. vulgare]